MVWGLRSSSIGDESNGEKSGDSGSYSLPESSVSTAFECDAWITPSIFSGMGAGIDESGPWIWGTTASEVEDERWRRACVSMSSFETVSDVSCAQSI